MAKQIKFNKQLLKFAVGLSLVLQGTTRALALDLTAPIALESSQVLPGGVKDPRFLNILMSIDTKFDGAGQSVPLGDPLNQQVRWTDVISIQSNVDAGAVRSTLRSAGLDANGSPGSTTGQVNTFVNVKVPALAVGVTDKLTVAIALPIMNVSIAADTGFVRSAEGQSWVDQLCTLSIDQCNQAADKLNNSVNQKLNHYGYQPIRSKNFSSLGDIQLVGKYLIYQDEKHHWTLKSTLVVPTGIAPNVDLALDVPTGDGRFQFGETVVYDHYLTEDLRWNAYGGLMALLPNQMEKRIPVEINNPISGDKEKLTRNLSASFAFGTSMKRLFPSLGLTAGAGYSFQFMPKVRYSGGTQFVSAPMRYSFLEDLTPVQVLHSATLMAGFSTVEWYQNKKFFYPFQANLILSHPLLGRSVTTNDVVSGELVLFF